MKTQDPTGTNAQRPSMNVMDDTAFDLRGMKLPFTAENFLLSFSQPNFYFHAATAYDILRAKGLSLGKRDFLGQLRMKL